MVLPTSILRDFTRCLWHFRRLKPYCFVSCLHVVSKIMTLIKVQADLHMDVQCESQYPSYENTLWFSALNSMNWLKSNGKALQACTFFFLVREFQMVSKIFCKIRHILEAHDKDINFIRAGQSKSKRKDFPSIEKGALLHCWWGYKLVQPLWKIIWSFLKKLHKTT